MTTPALLHPLGVDLGDALVFPLEVLRPGGQVDLGVGGCGHGLICSMRFILPLAWDRNLEDGNEMGGDLWETTPRVARPEVRVAGHRGGRVETEDEDESQQPAEIAAAVR
jgi:hypothetical protein